MFDGVFFLLFSSRTSAIYLLTYLDAFADFYGTCSWQVLLLSGVCERLAVPVALLQWMVEGNKWQNRCPVGMEIPEDGDGTVAR